MEIHSLLKKYWGFSAFRPLQQEIIQSVLQGNDAIALMPTGGGKSLCYQVPAMAMEGICIVVTPLVALMKDQVEALKEKGIKAVALNYGMGRMEIDIAVDNCIYGNVKFLYLSPERLLTEIIRSRLPKMKVNLLAVDEAHCISQWGHDFRPPYLRIAEIREFLPKTPVLALTATATPHVITDIQNNLKLKTKTVFRKSFERKNLAYVVLNEEDKLQRLLRICKNVNGPGIVYVRNRRKTKEIADFLRTNKITADFYHAGLSIPERDQRQKNWMKEQCRVIVATNAFGMGIDKPNVRFVIHLDLPDSPEAYFQEAGRAGRDGIKSYAVLLYNNSDILDLKQFHEHSFPGLSEIKNIYNCLGNFFQLAIGSGKGRTFPFDLHGFSSNYSFQSIIVYNSLRILEKEGYLAMSDALINPSRLMFLLNKEDLYRFQVANPSYDNLIKVILRSHSGLFSEFSKISEIQIAKRLGSTEKNIEAALNKLHQMNVVYYQKRNESPTITFLEQRLTAENLRLSPENYRQRKQHAEEKTSSVINYAASMTRCRSSMLLDYFGEKKPNSCGHCDICLKWKKTRASDADFKKLADIVKPGLMEKPLDLDQIVELNDSRFSEDILISVIRWLLDNNFILKDGEGKYSWNKKYN